MHSWFEHIQKAYSEFLIGQENTLQLLLVALLSNGHALLEGYPGTGKTFGVKVLSRLLGVRFERIQFTPDLLPSDILGHLFYSKKSESFSFRKGPIFSNLILADEINRTPPKTQASLLEAMEEFQVSVEKTTYPLKQPFFVLATQNPIELAGTYPLPEAQLDRFMVMIRIGFPSERDEKQILNNSIKGKDSKTLDFSGIKPITNYEEIVKLKQEASIITVSDEIIGYILKLVRRTRKHRNLTHGGSPRAATHLLQLSKVWALKEKRDFVLPDDIQKLYKYVLYHRIILSTEAQMQDVTKDIVLDEILASEESPR